MNATRSSRVRRSIATGPLVALAALLLGGCGTPATTTTTTTTQTTTLTTTTTTPGTPVTPPVGTLPLSYVTRMSFSADGTLLATSDSLEVLVWDLATPAAPKVQYNFSTHSGFATLSADGLWGAVGQHTFDAGVVLYSLQVPGAPELKATFHGPNPENAPWDFGFPTVSLSGDGSSLAMTDATNTFVIHYDLQDVSSPIPTLLLQESETDYKVLVKSVSLSSTGDLLAVGRRPDDAIVLDVTGAAHTTVYNSFSNSNAEFSVLSSDGRVLANSGELGAEIVDFLTTSGSHEQSGSQLCVSFPRSDNLDRSGVQYLLAVSGDGGWVARIHGGPSTNPVYQVLLYSHGRPDVSDPDNVTPCSMELKATLEFASQVSAVALSGNGEWLTVATQEEVTIYSVAVLAGNGGAANENYAAAV